MRQLLNFHFRNGLDLNNDDDWDEVTITHLNKKKNAAAHTVSDNYYDESYFENEEGFCKGYSKQVKKIIPEIHP